MDKEVKVSKEFIITVLDRKTNLQKKVKDVVTKDVIIYECECCNKLVKAKYRPSRFANCDLFLCGSCKRKRTCLEKYNVEYVSQSEKIKERKKKICLSRYGVKNIFQSEKFKEKSRQTCLDKYNTEHYSETAEFKEKSRQTMLKKYNIEYSMQSEEVKEKIRQTCLSRYGVDSYSKTDEFKERDYTTKKKNNTFNSSRTEEDVYIILQQKFDEVIRQHKADPRYLFQCDFYIPKKDLFIECNFHWTHFDAPFDCKNIDHLMKLDVLFTKAIKSKFYAKAIETWSIRDVKKRECAAKNNLNYLEFFQLKEFYDWVESCSDSSNSKAIIKKVC